MAVEVRMPQLSDTMETGTLVAWHVEEGDAIERGDVLAEIETDKANMELEAFDEGVLLKKLVQEGEEAPTQALIAVIGEEGEDISELLAQAEEGASPEQAPDEGEGHPPGEGEPDGGETAQAASPGAGETGASEPAPDVPERTSAGETAKETPETPEAPRPPTPQEPVDGRVRATPVARRMAARHGVDLRAVDGSGPQGRVMKKDVEEALRQGVLRASPGEAEGTPPGGDEPTATPVPSGETRPSPLSEETRQLSGMRQTIARRMSEAWEAPHFNLQQEIDMQPALEVLEDLNDARGENDGPLGVNDLLLLAVSRALCEEPRMNAAFEGDSIHRFGHVHLAFAVAVEDGLFTPVIRDAETLPLEAIHARSRELIRKARAGRMVPDDYQGGTFTVSNLGMFDVKNFSAVINPPQAGILAVGAVREVPVAEEGMVGVGRRMDVTLGCDHRAVDGVIGARFLQAFRRLMEHPIRLFR